MSAGLIKKLVVSQYTTKVKKPRKADKNPQIINDNEQITKTDCKNKESSKALLEIVKVLIKMFSIINVIYLITLLLQNILDGIKR